MLHHFSLETGSRNGYMQPGLWGLTLASIPSWPLAHLEFKLRLDNIYV